MTVTNNSSNRYIESKQDVLTYIDRLKYALKGKQTKITLQAVRFVDIDRDEKYSNRYAIAKLFPDEDIVKILKRELERISIDEYIETVNDINFPNRSDMRVFGRIYDKEEVYIKLRVDMIPGTNIFVMSFHFSTIKFKYVVFPYCNK